MLILEIISSWKVSHTKSELRTKLSDLIGVAEKFYYKFMIRMPLFGSDSNIILIKSDKQLSFQDLRSRLQTLIKLLQVSIQERSGETQLTTFHYCLVSSAWEEEVEHKVTKKYKQNLNLLMNLCEGWEWQQLQQHHHQPDDLTSEPAGGPERHRAGPGGPQLLSEAEGGRREPLSPHHHGKYRLHLHLHLHQLNISTVAWPACSWWNKGCWRQSSQEKG